MNIGLDYDDTFTRDPALWEAFIARATSQGRHKVYIVTWRDEDEAKDMNLSTAVLDRLSGIYATNRQAKEAFMYAQGIRIDVMIDDNPRSWVKDMEKL